MQNDFFNGLSLYRMRDDIQVMLVFTLLMRPKLRFNKAPIPLSF